MVLQYKLVIGVLRGLLTTWKIKIQAIVRGYFLASKYIFKCFLILIKNQKKIIYNIVDILLQNTSLTYEYKFNEKWSEFIQKMFFVIECRDKPVHEFRNANGLVVCFTF